MCSLEDIQVVILPHRRKLSRVFPNLFTNFEKNCISGKIELLKLKITNHSVSYTRLELSNAEEHGNPLQYSCLENPMDRGSLKLKVNRVTKSQT